MIFGFDSFGKHLLPKIADHVLVFMLRGIRRKYKHTIFVKVLQ